ncbi:MAG: hypothetical protein ACYC2G_04970 [Gemmatimonadaceae bacterium]
MSRVMGAIPSFALAPAWRKPRGYLAENPRGWRRTSGAVVPVVPGEATGRRFSAPPARRSSVVTGTAGTPSERDRLARLFTPVAGSNLPASFG